MEKLLPRVPAKRPQHTKTYDEWKHIMTIDHRLLLPVISATEIILCTYKLFICVYIMGFGCNSIRAVSKWCVLFAEYDGGGRELLAEPEIPAPRELMLAFFSVSVRHTYTLSGIGTFWRSSGNCYSLSSAANDWAAIAAAAQ